MHNPKHARSLGGRLSPRFMQRVKHIDHQIEELVSRLPADELDFVVRLLYSRVDYICQKQMNAHKEHP